MCLVNFDSSVWRMLVEFEETKSPVKLSNCEVKCLRLGEELEILVAKRTEVTKSGKVFDVVSSMRKAPGKVIVDQVAQCQLYHS